MFLASKLFFATKFYPIPTKFQKDIQNSLFQYVNFPNKVITIGQKEMWKIKLNGGTKLVNIQIKSEASKAKWLMDLVTNHGFLGGPKSPQDNGYSPHHFQSPQCSLSRLLPPT